MSASMTHSEMTAADRAEELHRQLRLVEREKSSIVVCPWCGSINTDPEAPDCCPDFSAGRNKRAVLQLEEIATQFADARRGLTKAVKCPYCDRHNYPGDPKQHPCDWKRPMVSPYCCDKFEAAATAIAERMVMQAGIEKKKRIEDGMAKADKN